MSEITLETTGLQQSRQYLFENAILTTVSNLYNRIGIAELSAPIPETQCCFLKIADLLALSQPQNAVQASHPPDLLIIASTITPEFAPTLTRLYEQMTTPNLSSPWEPVVRRAVQRIGTLRR